MMVALSVMGTQAQVSVNKKELADSLTAFCAEYASVGKIKVTSVKVRDDSKAEIYAAKQLSTIPFSEESVQVLYERISNVLFGRPNGSVKIYCGDREHEISTLVSSFRKSSKGADKPFVVKKGQPLVENASAPYTVSAGLQGEHIALYGSHGIYFNQKQDAWLWQRAKLLTTVEDLYTTGYVMPFLTPMLENAGAVVIQPRERDTQLHEVIVDNTDAQADGEWVNVTNGGWGPFGEVLLEGDNPFTMGGYCYKPCTAGGEGNSLTYTPMLPEAGEYAVYVSYKTVQNSSKKARYIVCHRGVETQFVVNQTMGSSMWVYLGTFDFSTESDLNYVRLLSEGPAGQVVTGDAVKFGGGWGCVARYTEPESIDNVPSGKEGGSKNRKTASAKKSRARHAAPDSTEPDPRDNATISGYPRWIEGARYWMQYSGVPDSVYNYTESKNDYIDDYASRGQWANWLAGGSSANPKVEGQHIPLSLFLAFHTDAGNIKKDSIVGTLIIYTDFDGDKEHEYPGGASRQKARDYADYVQTQIVEDIRTQYAPEWTRRMLNNSSYSESRTPKIPAVLLELLSHQNFADMVYGLDPRFRFTVSRAIYKGMLRFLHEQYGTPYVVQPLPVKDFSAQLDDNNALLSWTAVSDSLESTAEPEYYVVYTRIDDGDWDNGWRVATDKQPAVETTIPVTPGKRYDFKVVAGNAGGISFPSEVLSVYKAKDEKGRVLIVNGFNRVGAPDMLMNDSLMAGFAPTSYPVAYKKDVIYIGAEYDFVREHPWTSDDDQGYGACYADKAKETEIGNTFDYPVMHGKVLQKLGYSFCSCAASAVDSAMLAKYETVDLIMGKQKETSLGVQKITKDFKTFTPNLQAALRTYSGNLICSGAYIGSDMRSKEDQAFTKEVLHYEYRTHHATHSGKVKWNSTHMPYSLVMDQNPAILPAEDPDAIRPAGDGAKIVAKYDDSGLVAAVSYQDAAHRQIIVSFPLESLTSFEEVYSRAILWLMK